jgi:glycosyltransferase involved in cell wall biosynthesis
MLDICIASIRAQTCRDYIHIIHRDDKTAEGYGGLLANQSLAKIKFIDAHYVMVLDDDDMLIEPRFVETFKAEIVREMPEIVFFKGETAGFGTLPGPECWGRAPIYTGIASFCFAVRTDVWHKYVREFGKQRFGGDFRFIAACYRGTTTHAWLDLVVAGMQGAKAGRGQSEEALLEGKDRHE